MTLGQRSFNDLSARLYDVPFVVLDLETTGGSAASCEITEIGAVRYEHGELVGTFQTLVNPGVEIPPYITVLTGITHAMVVEAPRLGEALPSLLEFIGDAVIVGQNIRFDMSFLNAAALRLGYGRLANKTADTVALARRLVRQDVRNLKLATLAAHFRSPVTPNHRALEDAKATAHVFFRLLEIAGTIGVTHLDDLMALPTARGAAHYDKIELTDALPRRPGVYLFKDRNSEIIYVGKAKNLRTRVRSYFYGDTRKSVAQMMRDLVTIDFRVCESELEAEITELRLIGAHRPRYNRRSKPPKSPYWLKVTVERFPRLSLVRSYRGEDTPYLGPFRSRRHAEVVMHALWDALPLRRCIGRGGKKTAACNFAQLGVAVCPCDGSMPEERYAEIVNRLREGIETDPAVLLAPIYEKMRSHAENGRYEEAAWVRDRYRALARALERRRRWSALQQAEILWVEEPDGAGVIVERGHLVAAWGPGTQAPLTPLAVPDEPAPQVPPFVAAAEEADLIWKWLDTTTVRIIDSTRPFAYPARRVPPLLPLSA